MGEAGKIEEVVLNLFLWVFSVCVLFIHIISIIILCVSWKELPFTESNQHKTSTGCLVVKVSHLEVNNSTNINDIILCFSGLIENRITFHLFKEMVWSIEERTFCVILYLETKSLKTVQVRYCRSFNFNNFSHKFQITHWVKTFKDTGTLITSTKKGQKSRNGRKLTARSPENVDAVRDSVGQSPKKSLRRCSQELGLSRSFSDMPVVRKQDWRKSRFSSECVIQWWSSLLSIRPCQQQEICVLGISSTRWSPSETTALCKVHCLCCHIKTCHNRTILVWERCWRDNDS